MHEINLYRKSLAVTLRKLRLEKNFSSDDLAEFCGLSRRSYYRYEDSESGLSPKAEFIPVLAHILSVSTDELFGLSLPVSQVNPLESVIIEYYRQMPPDVRTSMDHIVRWIYLNRSKPHSVELLRVFLQSVNPRG